MIREHKEKDENQTPLILVLPDSEFVSALICSMGIFNGREYFSMPGWSA